MIFIAGIWNLPAVLIVRFNYHRQNRKAMKKSDTDARKSSL